MTRAERLLSIASGVVPELAGDPAAFIAAAAVAGWRAAGIWFDPETWTAATTRDVKRVLDDTGLVPLDMEVIRIGSTQDCGDQLVDAAGQLGVRNILSVSTYEDPAVTADRLAALCRQAAPADINVCIEFMAFTAVKTLADAVDVVGLAGEPNAGVLVDLLHVHRSGTTYDEIAAAAPSLFPYAQWCDASAEPRGREPAQLYREALDERAIPGHGDLDAVSFDRLFASEVPFSIEVRSRWLREAFPDPTERASYLLVATRATHRARTRSS